MYDEYLNAFFMYHVFSFHLRLARAMLKSAWLSSYCYNQFYLFIILIFTSSGIIFEWMFGRTPMGAFNKQRLKILWLRGVGSLRCHLSIYSLGLFCSFALYFLVNLLKLLRIRPWSARRLRLGSLRKVSQRSSLPTRGWRCMGFVLGFHLLDVQGQSFGQQQHKAVINLVTIPW